MKRAPQNIAPADADTRKAVKPVVCYPVDTLPLSNMALFAFARDANQRSHAVGLLEENSIQGAMVMAPMGSR